MCFLITTSQHPTSPTTGEIAEFTIRLITLEDLPTLNVQEIIPRLLVNNNEVRIRQVSWQKSRGAIGIDCEFTLADIADRSLITDNASITLNIGTKEGLAAIQWNTIASLQKLSSRNFTISGDTFRFSSISGVSDKLNTSPARPFMMYDPEKVPLNSDEIEQLYDSEGRLYELEAISVVGLTLHQALEEIFVNRCGFTEFDPNNVPDFPIPQVAASIQQTFLDAVWPYIEPFGPADGSGPLLTEENGVLTIHDMSHILPDGFPIPPDLTIFGCSELSVNAAYSDAAAVIMSFSAPDTFDYVTNRLIVTNLPTGDNLSKLTIRNIHELRSFYQPNVVMDERDQVHWESIFTPLLFTVSKEVTYWYYDKYARETLVKSERWIAEPGQSTVNPFGPPTETATQYTIYSQHPRTIGRQYQSKIIRQVVGKISVDAENPYRGQPFRQALTLAHWSGNHPETSTIETGNLRTVEKTFTPLRNGQVSRKIFDYSNVRELALNVISEPAVGDISVTGFGSRSREMLITEDDSEYTSGLVIPIAVGPIPIEHAKPLVQRKLRRMKTHSKEAVLNIIGFNRQVKTGLTFSVSDKLEQIEGTFICVGYGGECVVNEDGSTTSTMNVEAIEV